MKNIQKLIKLFCLEVSFSLVLSACGNSSYNNRSLILSNEDSYTYKKCADTGSTDASLEREFQGFNGKDTIWLLEAADDASISLDVSANLSSGKFKVLLVSNNNDITTLLEGDGTQNTSVDLGSGTARIMLVGDHANGSCEITLSQITNVSISSPSGGLDSEEWMNDFFDDWMQKGSIVSALAYINLHPFLCIFQRNFQMMETEDFFRQIKSYSEMFFLCRPAFLSAAEHLKQIRYLFRIDRRP